jgi:fatty aldehyde-generating acyl-ACP reductase
MGGAAAGVTGFPAPAFAALGHQESWSQIAVLVHALRTPARPPLTDAELREIVPWIPPRTVSRVNVAAAPHAMPVPGIYIETFITPDELALRPTRRVLEKVRDGIRAAGRERVRLATLGGFTSILLEATVAESEGGLALTTGNTLTAALIVRGVERAVGLLGRRLETESLLVIGATGDVGSACARYFAGRMRRLLLAARSQERLERETAQLRAFGAVEASTDVSELLGQSTIVIAAASTPEPTFALEACPPGAIVCDAGYPKNIRAAPYEDGRRRLFWGGMGILNGGMKSHDGVLEQFYRFPVANAVHGCMLEGMVLAIAGRFEPFSTGRGRITPGRVEEMWRLAGECGVSLAPLFDATGPWPEEMVS